MVLRFNSTRTKILTFMMDRKQKQEKEEASIDKEQQEGGVEDNNENEKVVLLANAKEEPGYEPQFTPKPFQADKHVVLAGCQQDGLALKYGSCEVKGDKEVVLTSCIQNGRALRFASNELKADKEVVLVACQQYGGALKHASAELKADKDLVLTICRQHGLALEFASDELKADKDVVTAAAASHPDALKFAKKRLNQDPHCLKAAQVWDHSYESASPAASHNSAPKIVLSTRFSLQPNSRSQATTFPVLLKENEYIQEHNILIYSPNAFAKDTCDEEWTRHDWPCRGTFNTCDKPDFLKSGEPQPSSCWRYSFRYQLEKAREAPGCMLQLVEREGFFSVEQSLGNGQKIEAEMAKDVGIKVFRVHAPEKGNRKDVPFTEEHIQLVASKLREWYEEGCIDMSECEVAFKEGTSTRETMKYA